MPKSPRVNYPSLWLAVCVLAEASFSFAGSPPGVASKAADPIESGDLEVMSRGPIHEAFAALPRAELQAPVLVRRALQRHWPNACHRSRRPASPNGSPVIGLGMIHWTVGCGCPASGESLRRNGSGSPAIGYRPKAAIAGYRAFGQPPTRQPRCTSPLRRRPKQMTLRSALARMNFAAPAIGSPNPANLSGVRRAQVRFSSRRVWVPSQYSWTPGGFVWVAGYWDWPFAERGWVFAPLGLTDSDAATASWVVTPEVLLNPNRMFFDLYVRPARGWYYSGDFDARRDRRYGLFPIAEYAQRHVEPIFEHLDWMHGRQHPNWLRGTGGREQPAGGRLFQLEQHSGPRPVRLAPQRHLAGRVK